MDRNYSEYDFINSHTLWDYLWFSCLYMECINCIRINLIPYFFAANTCIQLPVASQIYTIVRYVAPFIFAILLWQIIDYSSRNHFIDIFLKSIYFLCTYVGYNMWAKNNGYVICQTLIKNTVAKNKK